MAIDTTKKIKQVTYNGTEIPLGGYDTSDATVTAGDMASGVVAYGASGKVIGTVPTRVTLTTSQGTVTKSGQNVMIHGKYTPPPPEGRAFVVGSATIAALAPVSDFGNATAADVAKGKTFTSAAGLKVVGTAEGSSTRAVDIGLENTDFTEVWVGYVTRSGDMRFDTIPNGQIRWISVEEESVVVVVNTAFDGEEFNLVPNGGDITKTASTSNVTAFIADYSLNSKTVELLLQ